MFAKPINYTPIVKKCHDIDIKAIPLNEETLM